MATFTFSEDYAGNMRETLHNHTKKPGILTNHFLTQLIIVKCSFNICSRRRAVVSCEVYNIANDAYDSLTNLPSMIIGKFLNTST